jgi:hypothetical protein
VVLVVGCGADGDGEDIGPTTEAEPDVVATEAGTEEAVVPAEDLDPEAVQLEADPAVASGIVRQAVPEEAGGPDVPPWVVHPAHVEVFLEGYALDATFHDPYVRVYPVQAYKDINEPVGSVIERLETLLVNLPEPPPEELPFLPPFNAGQMFTAQAQYVPFPDGVGVRYLTQYSQAFMPVNNHELIYTFQGLTDDAAYYVSAVLPVSAPVLPDAMEMPVNQEAFIEVFEEYIAGVTADLDGLPDSDFTPTLAQLDALVSSITIEAP